MKLVFAAISLLLAVLTEGVFSTSAAVMATINVTPTSWAGKTVSVATDVNTTNKPKYNTTWGPKVIAMSPLFPENYKPNVNCNWTINPEPHGKKPRITISWLEIEKSVGCSKDRLEIRNGDTEFSPPFPYSPYCGKLNDLKKRMYGNTKENVNFSPNQSVWVKFVSDQSKDGLRGFLVTYESGKYRDATIVPSTGQATETVSSFPVEISVTLGIVLFLLVVILLAITLRIFMKRKLRKKQDEEIAVALTAWEIPLKTILLETKLGHGAFGVVWKGRLIEIPEWVKETSVAAAMRRKPRKTMQIAVKTIHEDADPDDKKEFMREIDLMKNVGVHRNIVNMLACCVRADPPLLIMEYVAYGDLLKYLRQRRDQIAGRNKNYGQYYAGRMEDYKHLGDAASRYRSFARRDGKTTMEGEENPLLKGDEIESDPAIDMTEEPGEVQNEKGNKPGDKEQRADQSNRNEYADTKEVQKHGKNMVNANKTKDYRNIEFKSDVDEEKKIGLEKAAGKKMGSKEELESDEDEDEDSDDEEIFLEDLLCFAWQISNGMEYLAEKGYVHRDLAARNIFVGHGKVAKVADFGLTRELGNDEEMYRCKSKRKLPVKWMSPEAVFDMVFTTKSDVWAYGVVLWEIITIGGAPYPSVGNYQLLMLLKQQYRMDKPDFCSDEIYDLMTKCWEELPENRPTFTELRLELEAIMSVDKAYLDLTNIEETTEYMNLGSGSEDEAVDELGIERVRMSFRRKPRSVAETPF